MHNPEIWLFVLSLPKVCIAGKKNIMLIIITQKYADDTYLFTLKSKGNSMVNKFSPKGDMPSKKLLKRYLLPSCSLLFLRLIPVIAMDVLLVPRFRSRFLQFFFIIIFTAFCFYICFFNRLVRIDFT